MNNPEYHKAYYLRNRESFREKARLYYIANRDKIKEASRIYIINNKEKCIANYRKYHEENREKRLEYYRSYYRKNKSKIKKQAESAHRKNVEKRAARFAVAKAIKTGTLKRLPCETCGDVKTQAHHADYSKPLHIKWVCRKCHGIEHRIINRMKRLKSPSVCH